MDGQTDVGHINLIGGLVTRNPPKKTITYCSLRFSIVNCLANGKQQPPFPLEARVGCELHAQWWEASMRLTFVATRHFLDNKLHIHKVGACHSNNLIGIEIYQISLR